MKMIRLIISIPIIILLLIFVAPIAIFPFTNEGFAPHTRQEVEKMLDKSLTVDYEYISTEIIKKPSIRSSVGENIYTFKDGNGIEFNVISSYIYWGGYEMTAQKESRCTYHTVLLLNYRDEVETALAEHLHEDDFILNEQKISRLGNSLSYHYEYRIRISDFNDLSKVADAVEAALNAMPPFPMKKEEYNRIYYGHTNTATGQFYYSKIPSIGVSYNYEYYFEWVDFYCIEDNKFDKEAFIKNIKNKISNI